MYISKKYFLITNKIVKLLIGPNKETGELNYMRMRKNKKQKKKSQIQKRMKVYKKIIKFAAINLK